MRKLISATLIGTITVLLLELVLRTVGTITPGGDWALSGLVVKPFHLPVQAAKAQVTEYLERGNSRIEYDPDLGWTARRSSRSVDGMYSYNSQRIRRPDDVAQIPNPSTLRILLLGDSLMHGDDVPYQDSLAALLESEFQKTDQSVEVLNLGMSGYGIDQAVFRYIKEGRSFAPQIVILGFQAENIKRNLTLSRALYTHGLDFIPFFKPRFILESSGLKLVGTPTPPPEMIEKILSDYAAWGPSKYDRYFNQPDFTLTWWRKSRLLGALESFLLESNKYVYESRERFTYSPESEAYQLALATIQYLQEEVRKDGAKFALLHLPMGYFLAKKAAGEGLVYQGLMDELSARYKMMSADDALIGSPRSMRSLYMPPSQYHFSGAGNQILAQVVAEQITTGF